MKYLFAGTNAYDYINLKNQSAGFDIYAYDGNDTVIGTNFSDYIDGGSGNDWIFAGQGNDIVEGGSGSDLLSGQDGNDILHGGDGADFIDGGAGNDVLYAEGGWYDGEFNTLKGGDGDDTLVAGHEGDQLWGGLGKDTFMYDPSPSLKYLSPNYFLPYYVPSAGTVTIYDFEASARELYRGEFVPGDKLDLSQTKLFKFTLADISATEAIAKGYIYWVQHNGETAGDFDTTVYIDMNGGAHDPLSDQALFEIEGVKATELHAANFIV